MPARPDQAPILPGLLPDDAQPTAMPAGFRYRPDMISPEEEADLAAWLATLEFQPYEHQGYLANRRVVWFGLRYDSITRKVAPAPPVPDQLVELRRRTAAFAGLDPEAMRHVLLNQYREGAPIGWHRDRPQFEDVVGVSLLSPCLLRMRRRQGAGFERASMTLEPRSAYVMQGPGPQRLGAFHAAGEDAALFGDVSHAAGLMPA